VTAPPGARHSTRAPTALGDMRRTGRARRHIARRSASRDADIRSRAARQEAAIDGTPQFRFESTWPRRATSGGYATA